MGGLCRLPLSDCCAVGGGVCGFFFQVKLQAGAAFRSAPLWGRSALYAAHSRFFLTVRSGSVFRKFCALLLFARFPPLLGVFSHWRGSGFLGGWRIQQWHIHRAPHGCRGIGRRFGGGVCQIFRRKQHFRLFCPCFRRRAGLFPLFAGVCAPYCRTADVLPFRGAGAVKGGIRRALADALFLAGGTVVFHQTVPSHLLNLFLPCLKPFPAHRAASGALRSGSGAGRAAASAFFSFSAFRMEGFSERVSAFNSALYSCSFCSKTS